MTRDVGMFGDEPNGTGARFSQHPDAATIIAADWRSRRTDPLVVVADYAAQKSK